MKKGLETIHLWKRLWVDQQKDVARHEKRLEELKDSSTTDEVRMVEKYLYAAMEQLSLLEKDMLDSWIEGETAGNAPVKERE